MPILQNKRFLKIICIAVAITFIYLFFLTKLSLFKIAQVKGADIFTKLAYSLKPTPNFLKKIAVIVIDDSSYKVLNKKWPWPRTMIAQLINQLKKYKPRVIGLDFGLTGESQDKNDDIEFANSLKESGNCILSGHFSMKGEYILPLQLILNSAKDVGFVNKIRDWDNLIRAARAVVLSKKGDVLDYCFEIKIAKEYLKFKSVQYNKDTIFLKDDKNTIVIPIDNLGGLRINYRAKEKDFKPVSFWRVLKTELPEDTFKDKIVLVGGTSEVFHDIQPTPLGIMPGVIILANAIQTILEKDFIKKIPLWLEQVIILLIALLVVFFTYRLSLIKALFFNIGFLSSIFFLYLVLFLKANLLLDFSSAFFVGAGLFVGISGFRYAGLVFESNILKNEAITDALTEIYSFRYFDLRLNNEFNRAKRYNQPLSLIILDIDHFKKINDTYGHDDGNIILKQIAKILKEKSRKVDIVARFGGEEFCIIIPQIDQEHALLYAERIREDIQNTPFKISRNRTLKVTISAGVSSFSKEATDSADTLLKSADTALYRAKNSGRNRVCS